MTCELFIHIGLPKTATTFVQNNIFPKYPNLDFLGKGYKSSIVNVLLSNNHKFLLSHEHMLACPFHQINDGWINEFERNLRILAVKVPHAKILLSFRHHPNLLLSYYKEYISKPNRFEYMSIDHFFDPINDLGFLKKGDLNFMKMIELVETFFQNKPFVFTLEEINNDLQVFVNALSNYLGEESFTVKDISRSKVNKGVKYYPGKILRALHNLQNRNYFPNLYNPISRKLGITPDRLFRVKLAQFFDQKIELTDPQISYLENHMKKDWKMVLTYIKQQRVEG